MESLIPEDYINGYCLNKLNPWTYNNIDYKNYIALKEKKHEKNLKKYTIQNNIFINTDIYGFNHYYNVNQEGLITYYYIDNSGLYHYYHQ